MYSPKQIVFGLESLRAMQIGEDVRDRASYPEITIHFRPVTWDKQLNWWSDEYCTYYKNVAVPKSTDLAEEAMRLGLICIKRPVGGCPKCGCSKHQPNDYCNADEADAVITDQAIRAKYGEHAVA